MAMSTDSEGTNTVKQITEAGGENGLLNLPAEETVFYVGGYPRTFSVSNAEHLSMERDRIETRDWALLTWANKKTPPRTP